MVVLNKCINDYLLITDFLLRVEEKLVYIISHNLSWNIISNPGGFLATAKVTLKINKGISFPVLGIAVELYGRSGSFSSDLTSLLFVLSVTENPVT